MRRRPRDSDPELGAVLTARRSRLPSPVAVVGLGLVGGSVARALRARAPRVEILGVDPDSATRARAVREGVVDEASSRVSPALARAALVIIGTPLGALDRVLAELSRVVAPEALVTDVIGLKAVVVRRVRAQLPRARYVGSHPMAGGEHGGFAHSRPDLFVDRTVVVCPGRDRDATARISALWRALGARVVLTTPAQHDRIVAFTSHLPYLVALGLVRVAEHERGGTHVAGRGFADATRRADFEPGIMAAVVGHNPHVPRALVALVRELERMARALRRDPDALVLEAQKARRLHRRLLAARQPR